MTVTVAPCRATVLAFVLPKTSIATGADCSRYFSASRREPASAVFAAASCVSAFPRAVSAAAFAASARVFAVVRAVTCDCSGESTPEASEAEVVSVASAAR